MLTMSRATVLGLAANAGIGGAKDSVTYLNIPVSSMHKVLIALRMDESMVEMVMLLCKFV